jgi:hypothetical protein
MLVPHQPGIVGGRLPDVPDQHPPSLLLEHVLEHLQKYIQTSLKQN